MAKIDKVQLRVTLRTRAGVYQKGATVMAPLPEDILEELEVNGDRFDLIEAPKPKPKPKAKKAPAKKPEPEVNNG